uniref:Ig-like domain-containing protein n=1 Tax=Anas platyrhynchos platyrhynchos TaxID=8840 RepID=A0A493TW59_ANAPP
MHHALFAHVSHCVPGRCAPQGLLLNSLRGGSAGSAKALLASILSAAGSWRLRQVGLMLEKNSPACRIPCSTAERVCSGADHLGKMLHQAFLHRALHGEVAWGSCVELCTGLPRERCTEHCVGTLHRPQVRIIPVQTGNARVPVRLSCHIGGFYAPEVTVIWLHNGDIVEPDDYNPISAIPNGDCTYQTQVSLLVAPVAGDTYTCSVQHVSLQEPLLEDWSEWRGAGPTLLTPLLPPAGYTPLPGDNYPAGNGVPICIGEG